MKKWLSLLLFIILTISIQAQKDTLNALTGSAVKRNVSDISDITTRIYPVPVKENRFTIRCNIEISSVKITNIIGQDIFRAQYKNPLQIVNILLLSSPRRGMYLVTIVFIDGRRVVKKILIEESV